VPEKPPFQPISGPPAAAPPARRAAHVQRALAVTQARLANAEDTGASARRQPAPHVQAALAAVQARPAAGLNSPRPFAPHVRAALSIPQARCEGGPVKPVHKPGDPCCAACGRAAGGPTAAIQRATTKPAKKGWAPGNKKEKKLRSMKRNQVLVKVQEEERIESCEAGVGFAQTFDNHILHGEVSGNTHAGYHSENVTNFAAFGVCNLTGGPDGNGIYTATCTMNGRTNPKVSTFFPAGWDINRIRAEVAHAYCHPVDRGAIPGGNLVAWCGNAATGGILIGGRGPKNAITTAFPAFGGGFT
jgi:Bacterial EndoU nuclease